MVEPRRTRVGVLAIVVAVVAAATLAGLVGSAWLRRSTRRRAEAATEARRACDLLAALPAITDPVERTAAAAGASTAAERAAALDGRHRLLARIADGARAEATTGRAVRGTRLDAVCA